MEDSGWRVRRSVQRLFATAILLAQCACRPPLPNDLDALMELMNSKNQTEHVSAVNKLTQLYGKDGLIRVLGRGKPRARALAAMRLGNYSGKEVENALLDAVRTESDGFVRAQALCSLATVGTTALAIVEEAENDPDEYARYCAGKALAAIRNRLKRYP